MRVSAFVFAFGVVVFPVPSASADDEPAPPSADPVPADAPPASPPAAPTPETPLPPAPAPPTYEPTRTSSDVVRAEGARLGLELGFSRAFSGDADRLNASSPSLIPLGADVSFRASPTLLFGFHGHVALASRDDCLGADRCRARAYALGAHVETALSKGARSFVPWLRYGMGWELVYQGGQSGDPAGHKYRNAIDLMDLRLGGDFVIGRGEAGRTTRIGPFIGLVGGVSTGQTGIRRDATGFARDLDRDGGKAHLWFNIGVRGTLDP